jgi:MFS superfamily sulfate permease-like transporter
LLIGCVLAIPGVLNRIPLAALAAILFVTGYKLARISQFVAMYRAGVWQFVPYVATVAGLVFTDMLTGIVFGMLVGVFHILMNNYRLSHLVEDLGDEKYVIHLTEHMTFLNKAAVMNAFRELPEGCQVTVDASKTRMIDDDVKEVIRNYAFHAPGEGTKLAIIGLDDIQIPEPPSD